tara:strand:- start:41 stop:679 length:639 start_codon:yes stop_codon:yes gene_type:complete
MKLAHEPPKNFIKPNQIMGLGPRILGWTIPEKFVNELNKDCENVTKPENFEEHDFSKSLIGQIEIQAGFGDGLSSECDQWLLDRFGDYLYTDESKNMPKSLAYIFDGRWYNRTMKSKEYNPEHIHPNALLTSVGYLKLPSNFKEELSKPQKKGIGGGLDIIYGEKSPFVTNRLTLIPDVGTFFIFPATTRHAVYPMPDTITEERRSFSINFR